MEKTKFYIDGWICRHNWIMYSWYELESGKRQLHELICTHCNEVCPVKPKQEEL